MGKYKSDRYQMDTPSSYPSKEEAELFTTILSLETLEDAKNFFRDLLTMAEIKEFSNRWQVVKMLAQGKPYLEIAQTLGISTTTVSRCAYWLHNGFGGYKKAVQNLKDEAYARRIENIPKNEFERTIQHITRIRK